LANGSPSAVNVIQAANEWCGRKRLDLAPPKLSDAIWA
jgi:hypothetical protein